MTDWNEELCMAAAKGDNKAVEKALNNGGCVNGYPASDYTPLVLAVANKHLSTVRLLLDKGAEIDAHVRCHTALIEAAFHNFHEIVKLLLERGADPEITDRINISPYEWAKLEGKEASRRVFEEYFAEKEAKKLKPETPLEKLRRQRREKPLGENIWELGQ